MSFFADDIHLTFLLNFANIMVHFYEFVFESLPSRLQSLLLLLLPLFDFHNRLAWFYILGFLGIAACFYWFSPENSGDRAWGKFFTYTFSPSLYASHSSRLDWQCYLINGLFIETLTVDGTLIVLFLFDFTINFRHSHLWISYGWHLEHIFSSSVLHQIHHSQKAIHLDKNLAEVFKIPRSRPIFRYGQ